MKNPKLAIIVPSIRPEAWWMWFCQWESALGYHLGVDTVLITVWDLPEIPRKINIGDTEHSFVANSTDWNIHLCWKDIKPEWKSVIHTKSDSVRNLGFLKAVELGAEYIATLDDDVLPIDNLWADRMLHNLGRRVDPYTFYPAPYPTRGYPDKKPLVPVMLHHGLWEGVPDVYARDQQTYLPLDGTDMSVKTVPFGSSLSMCGMNIAFHRSLLPAMYFWPQEPYRRYGDIWCGLLAKKVIDLCGYAMTSGSPAVFHSRLSNMQSNLEHEMKGAEANQELWDAIRSCPTILPGVNTVWSSVCMICDHIGKPLLNQVGSKLEDWLEITREVV
jgi:hypothetical protein